MTLCGEEDRFRGKKIFMAPVQITTELSDAEKAKLFGPGLNRKDAVEYFKQNSYGNIKYTELFQEQKRRVENMSSECFTFEAERKFTRRHGNLVFLVGQPGIGKSTLLKHMVKEKLECLFFPVNIVFFIQFREIDYSREIDLIQFLAPFITEDDLDKKDRKTIIKKIKESKEIFIFMDGLHEAKIELPFSNQAKCSINSIVTAECFIQNLLAGNILPQSKKMITSRPLRIAQLPKNFQPKVLFTIQGFGEEALKQVCVNICDKNVGSTLHKQILGHIQKQQNLESYCRTPVICIMVMESFYKLHARKRSNSYLQHALLQHENVDTLTFIFIFVLKEWLSADLDEFQVKEISDLAFEGFNKDQFCFRKRDLQKKNINDQNSTTFFNAVGKIDTVMYFIHPMWQEFFTAVMLRFFLSKQAFIDVLSESKNDKYGTLKRFWFSVKNLFAETNNFKHGLLSKLGNDKYEVVARFLFGLCAKHNQEMMLAFEKADVGAKDETVDFEECKKLLQQFATNLLKVYKKSVFDFDSYFRSILPILDWLLEMKDDEFAKQAAAYIKNKISICGQLLPSYIPSINYVLRLRESDLALEMTTPRFDGNCFQYFFNELKKTLCQNSNVQVSFKMYQSISN